MCPHTRQTKTFPAHLTHHASGFTHHASRITHPASRRPYPVIHGHHVSRWHVCQDVMHLLEDEPAAGPHYLHLLANVFGDLRRRPFDQDIARVAAAAPEREPVSEVALKARWL